MHMERAQAVRDGVVMREITTHQVNPANGLLRIIAMDEPGHGGANHQYEIHIVDPIGRSTAFFPIAFQDGPIKDAGVNGLTHEALIAILIDRLEGFQRGPYNCEENLQALHHLREAANALRSLTLARMARGA